VIRNDIVSVLRGLVQTQAASREELLAGTVAFLNSVRRYCNDYNAIWRQTYGLNRPISLEVKLHLIRRSMEGSVDPGASIVVTRIEIDRSILDQIRQRQRQAGERRDRPLVLLDGVRDRLGSDHPMVRLIDAWNAGRLSNMQATYLDRRGAVAYAIGTGGNSTHPWNEVEQDIRTRFRLALSSAEGNSVDSAIRTLRVIPHDINAAIGYVRQQILDHNRRVSRSGMGDEFDASPHFLSLLRRRMISRTRLAGSVYNELRSASRPWQISDPATVPEPRS
jgi:hypothetical protein